MTQLLGCLWMQKICNRRIAQKKLYVTKHGNSSQHSNYTTGWIIHGLIHAWQSGLPFLKNVQTGCAAHPASYLVGNGGSFAWCKAARAWG
jgi:hypothetical protein